MLNYFTNIQWIQRGLHERIFQCLYLRAIKTLQILLENSRAQGSESVTRTELHLHQLQPPSQIDRRRAQSSELSRAFLPGEVCGVSRWLRVEGHLQVSNRMVFRPLELQY